MLARIFFQGSDRANRIELCWSHVRARETWRLYRFPLFAWYLQLSPTMKVLSGDLSLGLQLPPFRRWLGLGLGGSYHLLRKWLEPKDIFEGLASPGFPKDVLSHPLPPFERVMSSTPSVGTEPDRTVVRGWVWLPIFGAGLGRLMTGWVVFYVPEPHLSVDVFFHWLSWSFQSQSQVCLSHKTT